MLRHAIIGKAVDLVSGPGGLASFLRTRLLGARLAGPSLPLDVGHSAEIPAAIRRAKVILRDQHCRWACGYFLAHTTACASCRLVRSSVATSSRAGLTVGQAALTTHNKVEGP